jgi:hypothetical protein
MTRMTGREAAVLRAPRTSGSAPSRTTGARLRQPRRTAARRADLHRPRRHSA